MTHTLQHILRAYQAIDLAALDQIALLNRMDTKYVVSLDCLAQILSEITSHYYILEIDGKRIFNYETRYFDTPSCDLYLHHHNGKPNRFKVRCRRYSDSGITYFEIKSKMQGLRTHKVRVPRTHFEADLSRQELQYIPDFDGNMIEMLQTHFKRITLACQDFSERITIDFDLSFVHQQQQLNCEHFAIIEVKQDARSRHSNLVQALRKQHQFPSSFSKYAIGMAKMNPELKQNAFKPTFLHLDKLDIALSTHNP